MTTVAPGISKPKGHNKINDIQPLAWEITNIPDQISQVYALKLPDHWRIAIQNLEEVDRVSPITSLYASLHALAPEIVYFFQKSFSRDPEYRPKYWFITETFGEKLDTERLLWGIQGWLNACYPSSEASAVSKHLKASDLEWETLNLKSATSEVVEGALPGLVARWLLRAGFKFQLSNEAGQIASWSVRLAPSLGPEADLITWPPATVPRRNSEPSHSYYLKLRLGSVPWSEKICLLCQPGIRRWVSQPVIRVNGNGKKPYVDLVWGREKSVFIARQSPSWLTKRPSETSLLRLGLRKYYDPIWAGKLKTVLESLIPEQDIPDLMLLLTQPERFQPDILIVHDNFMSETHPVGLGIEAADRWEVFNYLSDALPAEIKPVPFWSKVGSFKRTPYSFAHKLHSEIKPEIRRNGALQMQAPALIEICSSNAAYWKEILLQELGLSADMFEKDLVEITQNGTTSSFKILDCMQSADLFAELPPSASESNEGQYSAEQVRARQIEKTLAKPNANAGILLEMLNYKEISKDSREARRDPKRAVRWGLAKAGRVSQFIQPQHANPDNYEQRVRNGIRDLLRQMDFHLNPIYTGFKQTSLPEEIDLIGFWQIRLNPRHRQRREQKVCLPLVIHASAGKHKLNVCIPGDDGPTWRSYHEAILTVPDFSGEYTTKEGVFNFFSGAIQKLNLSKPTLILISEQNLREIWPELKNNNLSRDTLTLGGIFPLENTNVRIARLRFSGYGEIPLVCPTKNFGRFQGLFHNSEHPRIFYSIQERPVSASRPSGLRQRDALRKLSWNPSTVEIVMARLHPEDVPEEWAWVVHRLREESTHTDAATLLPEPLHSVSKISEYVFRIPEDQIEVQ